jgi:hypothetical protein
MSSSNSRLYAGLAVGALAAGGYLYWKKRRARKQPVVRVLPERAQQPPPPGSAMCFAVADVDRTQERGGQEGLEAFSLVDDGQADVPAGDVLRREDLCLYCVDKERQVSARPTAHAPAHPHRSSASGNRSSSSCKSRCRPSTTTRS